MQTFKVGDEVKYTDQTFKTLSEQHGFQENVSRRVVSVVPIGEYRERVKNPHWAGKSTHSQAVELEGLRFYSGDNLILANSSSAQDLENAVKFTLKDAFEKNRSFALQDIVWEVAPKDGNTYYKLEDIQEVVENLWISNVYFPANYERLDNGQGFVYQVKEYKESTIRAGDEVQFVTTSEVGPGVNLDVSVFELQEKVKLPKINLISKLLKKIFKRGQ